MPKNMPKKMRVGIVGFGLIGQRRAKGLKKLRRHTLVAVCDPNPTNAKALLGEMKYDIEPDWQSLVKHDDIDVVIIAVPHSLSAKIAIAALRAGKHVLCEKPMGINAAEARKIDAAAARAGKVATVGFNYRFYPGVQKMKKLIDAGAIGKITHARMVYGHAGRPGMEREWKMKKKIAGGGALIDPGIHFIDLSRFLFGDFKKQEAWCEKTFWKSDVEDNAFVLLKTKRGVTVSAHFSTTEWKNLMRLEVFGEDGYIFLQGKSGYFGPQEITLGGRWAFLTGKKEKQWRWSDEEQSFLEELKAFFAILEGGSNAFAATSKDNIKALEAIGTLYRGLDKL
jgi:predicted dehydrogenase